MRSDSNFFKPVLNFPADFSEEDRARLTAAYQEKIAIRLFLPTNASVISSVMNTPLQPRETVGLYAQPNGADWYAYMVRLRTTTDLTPDEIHQIGLDEVARIHEEMQAVMAEVGFDGSLDEFFEFVNTDEQFFYDEAEELIQGYRDMSDHISDAQ